MTPLAEVADIETIWRTLTSAETDRAGRLIVVASAVVRRRFSDIDRRIASGAVDAVLAAHVVATMVKRAMTARTPEDAVAESIGEASRSWARGDGHDGDEPVLTDQLAALLASPGGRSTLPRTVRVGMGLPAP